MGKISIALIILFTLACTTNSKDDISGKWMMHKVIQGEQDVTSEHNPENDRYLILDDKGTFESGGKPFGKNSGKYTFKPEENTLFLDSDAGQEDDSYWNVRISNDTMYWRGYGSEWARNFQIIQVRE